jgi:hypothetical protein|tara:strand:+ start:376 stop:567 length:192 start_codon:yes stop_codon:yes gene_type:complete
MANATTAAGNNGVSGKTATTKAWRQSIAGTQGGTYSRSAVKSESQNLRFAYAGVEADTPTVSR